MKRPERNPDWPPELVEIWQNDMREIWDARIEPHSYNSYQNQLALYRALVSRYGASSVLDVGCAQATLAMLLAEDGLRVTAVDIRQPFLDYARSRYERGDVTLLAANVFNAPKLGEYDVVFGNQIIEHLVYPADFLRTLARYATREGVVIVTTPNHDYFKSSLPSYAELGDPRQHEHRQFSAGGGDHFFAYTEVELRKAAASAGLDVVDIFYFETPWISGHLLFRFLHGPVPVRILRAADRLALKIAPRKLAHQLGMVARRRA